VSEPVSRILYRAASGGIAFIYLAPLARDPFPLGKARHTRDISGRAAQSPILPCAGLGLPCPPDRSDGGGPLPHLFTHTSSNFKFEISTFKASEAVYSLWHWPSRRLDAPRPRFRGESCPMASGLSSPKSR